MQIEVDGKQYDIVPAEFKPNFETEDFRYADELKVGMVVLAEPYLSLYKQVSLPKIALVYNRWCEVTRPRIDGNILTFIGLYEDGSKHVRSGPVNDGWYVKNEADDTHHVHPHF